MKRFILPALLCICLGARAQEKDSLDIFHQHLELNEIVVTGLTGDSRLRETPAPVTVISATALRATASTNVIDAIASRPGLSQVTTGSGISKPVIRGLGYNRVLVLNDGIRQEGQQWGDEHGVEIDGNAVHSVEILKGPASLMYGSDALAGVVIFHGNPFPAPETFTASLSSEYQSNSGLAAYSVSHAGHTGSVVYNLLFSDKYAHAYRNAEDGPVPGTQFRERAFTAKGGLNRRWGYSHATLGYYHLTPGMIEGDSEGPTGYGISIPFQQVRHYKAVLDNTFHLGDGNLKVLLAFQQNRRQEFEEEDGGAELDFKLNTVNYDFRYLSGDARGWKFAAGVNGMLQHSANLGEESLIPGYRLFDGGVFATATRSTAHWNVTGGVRGDVRKLDTPLTFTGVTGSIGAVYTPSPALNLRANLARGFRAPNLSELCSDGIHEGTLRYEVGNLELKPEYSLQGDLGLDFSSRWFSALAAFFCNRIDHYIYARRTGEVREGHPVYRYDAGDALLVGAEASLDLHPLHCLHLENTFSWVRGSMGEACLPLIPATRWSSELEWEITHDGKVLDNCYLALRVDRHFAQNRFLADTETATDGYTLLGAGAGTDLVIRGKKRARLTLVASNLTDKVYFDHLSRLKYAGIHNPGRNITVKVEIPIL